MAFPRKIHIHSTLYVKFEQIFFAKVKTELIYLLKAILNIFVKFHENHNMDSKIDHT